MNKISYNKNKLVIFYDINGDNILCFKKFYNINNDIELDEKINIFIKEYNKKINSNILNNIYYSIKNI